MNNKERFKKYCKDLNITPTNVKWSNGYFITVGENSEVQFRIKGYKGFLFGIWFNYGETIDTTDTLFYQPEIYLDKFSPTRSSCFKFTIGQDSKETINDVKKELKLLKKFKYQMIEGLEPIKKYYWKARKVVLGVQLENIKENITGHVLVPHGSFGGKMVHQAIGNPYFLKCFYLIKKYGYENVVWEYVFLK